MDRDESPDPLDCLTPWRQAAYDTVKDEITTPARHELFKRLVNMKPSIQLPRTDEDEDDLADDPEDNDSLDPSLTALPPAPDRDIIECEEVSESLFDVRSSTPTPGPKKRREMFRISESIGADKVRWQRLIEAVTLDYIHMGPEPILPGGDGHRQNLDHRKLHRIIATRYRQFFGETAPLLDDGQIHMVNRLCCLC
jgi:hypothetical protein